MRRILDVFRRILSREKPYSGDETKKNFTRVPKHVAIIMDGNGRWAVERGYPRTYGHEQGVRNVRRIVQKAKELGIEVLTFFVFSTENWQRPREEVQYLLRLLEDGFKKEIDELHRNNIRVRVLGRLEDFSEAMRNMLARGLKLTENNTSLTVNMALSYGGRDEIVRATRKIAQKVKDGVLTIEEIAEDTFSSHLDTAGLIEPDLVIRTGGEMRISNFLLWQIAYSELLIVEKYWPEFTALDLENAVSEYSKRERRFGKVK